MKEKFPKNTGEDADGLLEDVDALDAGLVSSGPESDDEMGDGLDPETGLPLEEVALSGLHIEGENEEDA